MLDFSLILTLARRISMNTKPVSNAVWFLSLLLVLSFLFTGSIANAASYQKTDGTIVDPIWRTPN